MQNIDHILSGLVSSLLPRLTELVNRKDYSAAMECYDAFRTADNPAGSVGARVHHLAAQAYHGVQDLTGALKTIRLAQASAEKEADALELAEIFMTLGAIQRDRGETRESLRAFTDA